MADEDIEQLLKKTKFGTKDERWQAIVAIGGTKAPLDKVRPYLYPIMTGETTDDGSEMCAAAISLVKLGDNSENVSKLILKYLQSYAENLPNMGLDSLDPNQPGAIMILKARVTFAREMASALGSFKNDKGLTDGLSRIIQGTSVEGYSAIDGFMPIGLIDACICGIGAIGHASGKELLEYWIGKGNVTAKAALELFGGSWDDIQNRKVEIEKKAKEAAEAPKAPQAPKPNPTKVEPKKKGFFGKLLG
jgi:hypothetical protein